MSRQTDQRQEDLAKWYYEHKPIVEQYDLTKRIEFLETVIHNLLYLQTFVVEDIQKIEGRNHLWMPNGVQISGDVRRLG